MGWWNKWFGRQGGPAGTARAGWHVEWSAAAAGQPGRAHIDALKARLDALALPEEEVELEREMVEGLEAVVALRDRVDASGLPVTETGHRVIGGETCHFSAPVFAPDEADHPGGRLLLTPTRAVFVGGGRTIAVPWHAVTQARQSDRDLILIRADRERLYRFRCNSFGDAMTSALLARRLMRSRS